MNPLVNALGSKGRKTAYTVLAIVALALGATHVAFSQGVWALPDWLKVAEAVFLFLAGALGFPTAASNITKPDPQNRIDPQV